jgi:hypothetical protein
VFAFCVFLQVLSRIPPVFQGTLRAVPDNMFETSLHVIFLR